MEPGENLMADEQGLPILEEGPTQNVIVETPADDTVTVEAEGAGAEKGEDGGGEEKPARQPRGRVRIEELNRRLHETESVAERYARELQDTRAQLETARREKAEADAAAIVNYERALAADLSDTKRAMAEAIATGDAEKQAELNVRIAELTNQKQQAERWKAANSGDRAAPPAPPPREAAAGPVPVDQRTADWVNANPYVKQGTADFDQEMAAEALQFAGMIERRLLRTGRKSDIGGEAYYAEIDAHMRQEFPDYFEGDQGVTVEAPARRAAEPVAPVHRSAPAGGAPLRPSQVRLSPDEQKLAIRLASSGALTGPGGKRLSNNNEIFAAYAPHVARDRAQQRNA